MLEDLYFGHDPHSLLLVPQYYEALDPDQISDAEYDESQYAESSVLDGGGEEWEEEWEE